jgi:hypothetical protein
LAKAKLTLFSKQVSELEKFLGEKKTIFCLGVILFSEFPVSYSQDHSIETSTPLGYWLNQLTDSEVCGRH